MLFMSRACVPCAGVFMKQTSRRDSIYVKKRLGFVKLAIQAGIDIIPVYHLGQSQVLKQLSNAITCHPCSN